MSLVWTCCLFSSQFPSSLPARIANLQPPPQVAAGVAVGLLRAVTLEGEPKEGALGAVTLRLADVEVLMNMNRLLLHGASPVRFLHTSLSAERLLRIKCKSHIYWYESDHSVTFSQQRV